MTQESPAGQENVTIWQELRNAVFGSEADYTKISLKRAIFLLAIPMILELVMESTFAVADIFFVGKLGAEAVATVGLTETFFFLLYALAMGLATAVTATVARRIGEKKLEDAGLVAVQSILLGLFFSIPFALTGLFFTEDLLRFMGADQWALTKGLNYTRWMLGGNLVIMWLFVINAIFRGAGDAAIAMRILWISNGVNLILDPLLIFGWGPVPALGIEGAAIATNIGRGTGVAIQLYYLIYGGKHIRILKENRRIDWAVLASVLKTSIGGIGQMIVAMTSWIFLMRIIAELGSEAVAGTTIAIRIMMFTMMPAWGLSNAAATLVGQNLGAGQPDRAEHTVWKIGFYNMGFMVFVAFVYFFWHQSLMEIFTSDARVAQIGGSWLKIVSYSYFVYGWWMVSTQAFNGAGDTKTPTYINLVFFWLIQLPLCWWLAIQANWGVNGIFWGIFFSETGVGLFTLWLFSRGGWKKMQV